MDHHKKNEKLNKHLSKVINTTSPKYSWQRIPDDPSLVSQKYVRHWENTDHKDYIKRLNFDKSKEISVARVAMLKDGSFISDTGNADPYFEYAAGKLLMNDAKDDLGDDN